MALHHIELTDDADDLVDATPIMLRAVDRDDDPQELMILLADQQRMHAADLTVLQTIMVRDFEGDPLRARRRAVARILEAVESAARVNDTRERLTRALRAGGRL